MNTQPFNYWNYIASSYQTSLADLPPDVAEVPSLTGSPASLLNTPSKPQSNTAKMSMTNDHFPAPPQQPYYPQIATDEQLYFGAYNTSINASDMSSDPDSPICSPHPAPPVDPAFTQVQNAAPAEKTHTTSGRRRAQNRAAQRAFRERKEKHARDLEAQLSAMNDKYARLEASHSELNIAYEKLRRTVELLTADEVDEQSSLFAQKRSGNADTLRKLLEILHGEFKAAAVVKKEEDY